MAAEYAHVRVGTITITLLRWSYAGQASTNKPIYKSAAIGDCGFFFRGFAARCEANPAVVRDNEIVIACILKNFYH